MGILGTQVSKTEGKKKKLNRVQVGQRKKNIKSNGEKRKWGKIDRGGGVFGGVWEKVNQHFHKEKNRLLPGSESGGGKKKGLPSPEGITNWWQKRGGGKRHWIEARYQNIDLTLEEGKI